MDCVNLANPLKDMWPRGQWPGDAVGPAESVGSLAVMWPRLPIAHWPYDIRLPFGDTVTVRFEEGTDFITKSVQETDFETTWIDDTDLITAAGAVVDFITTWSEDTDMITTDIFATDLLTNAGAFETDFITNFVDGTDFETVWMDDVDLTYSVPVGTDLITSWSEDTDFTSSISMSDGDCGCLCY